MRQNHPETSLLAPPSIPKHILKPFLGVFSPQIPQKRLSPPPPPLWLLGTCRPYKTAKTSTGPSCATPKPACGGPCGQPSAWMPPTVSQDTTQSLWDPTLGFLRAPWVRQNPTCKIFTVFQPNLPCKAAKTPTGPSCATPKPVCGGPCGQPRMPPSVSQDTIQSLSDHTLGSPGHPRSGKIQLVKFSVHPFGSIFFRLVFLDPIVLLDKI